MKIKPIFKAFYLKTYKLVSIFPSKFKLLSAQHIYTFLIVLVLIWIYSLIILIHDEKKIEEENSRQNEVLLDKQQLSTKMSQSIQLVDDYCRRLERIEFLSQKKSSFKVLHHQDEINEKEENQLKLLNAKKEKLIRDNVLYFPELKQMWCLVPKAASTTWSSVIMLNLNQIAWNLTTSQNSSISLPIQVILKQKFGFVNKDEYNKAIHSDKVQKILLVRHPFERIVSAFQDKLADRKSRSDGLYFFQHFGSMIYRRYRKNRQLKKREPTFKEFIQYLIDTDPLDYDEHWKPISLLCGLCHVRYDFIIKVEELQSLSHIALLKQLNLTADTQLPWLNKISSQSVSSYFKNIKAMVLEKRIFDFPVNYEKIYIINL